MDFYETNNSPISGKTVICGIIGDPVEHTLSPAMHNAAFQNMRLEYVYLPFRVETNNLGRAIQGMRALNIRGLNVTIPHKRAIIATLDEIDPLAEAIGAVNTVVNTGGLIRGYNTDASGFIKSLAAEKVNPNKKNIVVLGAGGAARAIAFILADRGADLTILNRHRETAQGLADWIMKTFRREVKPFELNLENMKISLIKADILVNTTSVGMSPNINETLVPAKLFKPGSVVIDIIYNPYQTLLLTEAADRGAKVISGLEMLVQQGAESFELWTGRKAPVDIMRKAAMKALSNK